MQPRAADTPDSEAFWADPPWRAGRTPFRMGLTRLDRAAWLCEPITAGERERKLSLMARGGRAVTDVVAGCEAQDQAVAAAVAAELAARPAFAASQPRQPAGLAEVALWVPEDLCLLAPSASGYRLLAASLCAPSFWRLQEKIGRPMHGVHGAVKGLNEAVGSYVARFFERLEVGEVFQRRNWNLHRTFRRFHPQPEVWPASLGVTDCAGLCMRSETQTLRKFGDGALLFTIRVRRFPLGEIRAYPDAVTDLLAAVSALSDDERQATVFSRHGETLVRYLRGLLASG